MNIAKLATFDFHEAKGALYKAATIVAEDNGAAVLSFPYANYNIDARPRLLLLGRWKNPHTQNQLVGGINLNYLNNRQITKLQQALPTIMRQKSLQSRYRIGKRLLPQIFTGAYRTYDQEYIQAIQPGTPLQLGKDATTTQATAAATTAQQKSRDAKAAAIIKQRQQQLAAAHAQQTAKTGIEPEQSAAEPDLGPDFHQKIASLRAAQQQTRQQELAKQIPATGSQYQQPADPDQIIGGGAAATKQPSRTPEHLSPGVGPDSDTDDDLLQQQDDTDGLDDADEFDVPVTDSGQSIDDLIGRLKHDRGDIKQESTGFKYSPALGFIWNSPTTYRQHHTPSSFYAHRPALNGNSIAETIKNKPLAAIHDLVSGQTIIDKADHAQILYEAGWGYDHTIRLTKTPDGVVPQADDLSPFQISSALRRISPLVFQLLGGGN